MPAVWTYYSIYKFDWTSAEVGLSMGMFGLCVALVQGGLTGPAVKRFGERRAAVIGLVAGAIGFFGFAFAPVGWVLNAWIIPWSLLGMAMAAVRGLMSNLVPEDSQGELQGAMTAIFSLSAIVAPLVMTQLFRVFTSDSAPILFPGAPFFAAGLMMILSVIWFRHIVEKTPPEED